MTVAEPRELETSQRAVWLKGRDSIEPVAAEALLSTVQLEEWDILKFDGQNSQKMIDGIETSNWDFLKGQVASFLLAKLKIHKRNGLQEWYFRVKMSRVFTCELLLSNQQFIFT